MDKELLEQFELISGMIEKISHQMATKDYVDERSHRTEVLIENTVSRKIEALFDSYKLTHEKQWELEKRMDELERQLAELRDSIA